LITWTTYINGYITSKKLTTGGKKPQMNQERFRKILVKEFGFNDDPNMYSILDPEADSNYSLYVKDVFLIELFYRDGKATWNFSEFNSKELQGGIYWDEDLQRLKPVINKCLLRNRDLLVERGVLSNQFNRSNYPLNLESFIDILSERFGFTTNPKFYTEIKDEEYSYIEYALVSRDLFTIQYIIDGDKPGTWYFTNYKSEDIQGANYWSTNFSQVAWFISDFLVDNRNLLIEHEILTVELILKGFTKKQALFFCEWFGEGGEQHLSDAGENQDPVIETPNVNVHVSNVLAKGSIEDRGCGSIYLHCKTVYLTS
jgi:hypothetical protein